MFKIAAVVLFLTPSFVFATETAPEAYNCTSKDADTGASIVADININGTVADVSLSTSGMAACKSVPNLAVTGQKPVLSLTGAIACEGDEPETVTLILDTSKKTLAFGETVFSCK